MCGASPGDAEADGPHVGQHVVEQEVPPPSALQVHVELGEFQLDVVDVVQEQHQDPHVVISKRRRDTRYRKGYISEIVILYCHQF